MRIVLADEISPNSCRLWDVKTNDKMDKDRFRKDLGGMVEAYTEVARRLGVVQENEYSRTRPAPVREIARRRSRSTGLGCARLRSLRGK